ncbi:MAG TPA: hypothetical protein PLU30_25270 [Verrucomicrobiae bacterium]|nr:hypothetical protein [Verrucomicrobiae bacterium]
MRILVIILLAFICNRASAETLTVTTTDGESIKDAEISRVTPDGLTIVTPEGIRKLKWSSLPPEFKAKYAAAASEQGNAELDRLRARVAALEQENGHLRSQIENLRGQTATPQAPTAVSSEPRGPATPSPANSPEPEQHKAYSKEWDRTALASKLDGGTQSAIKALLGPPTRVSAYSDEGDVWLWDGLTIIDRKSGARFSEVTVVFDKEDGRNARGGLVNFR